MLVYTAETGQSLSTLLTLELEQQTDDLSVTQVLEAHGLLVLDGRGRVAAMEASDGSSDVGTFAEGALQLVWRNAAELHPRKVPVKQLTALYVRANGYPPPQTYTEGGARPALAVKGEWKSLARAQLAVALARIRLLRDSGTLTLRVPGGTTAPQPRQFLTGMPGKHPRRLSELVYPPSGASVDSGWVGHDHPRCPHAGAGWRGTGDSGMNDHLADLEERLNEVERRLTALLLVGTVSAVSSNGRTIDAECYDEEGQAFIVPSVFRLSSITPPQVGDAVLIVHPSGIIGSVAYTER